MENKRDQFPYDFSIIMAVYNVELFLKDAIESVIAQDYGFEHVQLILVDDGSMDKSGEICDEYQMRFPQNIIAIHKSNGGVASARNEGLRYASGRYLNFMDSDDKFSPDVLRKVKIFFDENYEKVDVVTIPIYFFDAVNGGHWQNEKFRKGTRCINLNIDYQAPVSFVNASFFADRIKNEIWFDPKLCCGEDMKVLLTILSDKMKLGVVSNCKYYYRRRSGGEESLIQSSKKKRSWYIEYFAHLIRYSVEFYQQKFGYVPAFVQYMLLGDLKWRFTENYDMTGILNDQEVEEYKQRLYGVLRYFDDKYFLEVPKLYSEYKTFMLSKKHCRSADLCAIDNDIVIRFANTVVTSIQKMFALIEFAQIANNRLILEGQIRLCGVDEQEPLNVFLRVNGKKVLCVSSKRKSLNEYRLGELLYRGVSFRGEVELDCDVAQYDVEVVLSIKGIEIVKRGLKYGKFAPDITSFRYSGYNNSGWLLYVTTKAVHVEKCNWFKRNKRRYLLYKELFVRNGIGDRKAILARIVCSLFKVLKHKPIWLISDRIMCAGDNGEVFFEYLKKHAKREIDAYFVLSCDSPDYQRIKKIGPVVNAQSHKHKIMHLLCDVNISSHADDFTINPFFGHDEAYRDLLADVSFVFLQHGIIYNDASRYFNRFKINAKGFVTSTAIEQASIQGEDYGYADDQVWLTGLPRYDRLHDRRQRIITIMPTWRAYLVTANEQTGVRKLKPGFENSSYYKIYQSLICNERLIDAAIQYGYRIQFICHPNMQETARFFVCNEPVEIKKQAGSYQKVFEQSDILITDYSSAAFDFAYLRKPIVYIQADKEEFYSGRHTVSKGYFEYERDALGEVEYSISALVDRIIEYMKTNCTLKEFYLERIERFYAYHDRDNCERVYRRILELVESKR